MSSRIQHTLLELEITPPEAVWEKIAGELDDIAAEFQFPKKLQQLAVTPPQSAWEKINSHLDEELATGTVAAKLYAAEVIPPAAAWNNIKTSLDEAPDMDAPVKRRVLPLLKYAAAAAITGFLAFGAIQLFKPGPTGAGTASADRNIPTIEAITHANAGLDVAVSDDGTSKINEDEPGAREDAALEASKKTYAKLDMTPAKKADIASAFRFSSYISADDINEHSSTGYEEALSKQEAKPNRYILLMTPEGQFIRMSKKLGDLVCCVSGEEKDDNCLIKVDRWRKQLACSQTAHPGNFLDILSLVGTLQDK